MKTGGIDIKLSTLARFGYLARAVVYFLMGGLALLVAFGNSRGATTDSKGSLRQLLEQPMGHVFLGVLAIGLFCYALWRFYQAVNDYERQGTSPKGLVVRGGYLLGALSHLGLSIYALNLIFWFSSSASGGSERGFAQKLLAMPFGQILTGGVGLAIIAFGISQFIIAAKEKFTRHLSIPSDKRDVVIRICKFGLVSRGVIFAMIGYFFLKAGLTYSSAEAGGIARAWSVLRDWPYGNHLLMILAAGFVSFGVYGVTEAMYERTAGV